MRRLVAALAVAACAALTAGAADDEKYASKDGKYAIQFPAGAKVTVETKTIETTAGDIILTTTTAEAGDRSFAVLVGQMPAGAKDIPVKTLFDNGEAGGVARSGGKLISSKDFTLGARKLPARDVVVEADGGKFRSRFVYADGRLYALTVDGKKDFGTSKEATAFLDSFELTK